MSEITQGFAQGVTTPQGFAQGVTTPQGFAQFAQHPGRTQFARPHPRKKSPMQKSAGLKRGTPKTLRVPMAKASPTWN
jgi:hypothetical protein